MVLVACSTIPTVHHDAYKFPDRAFLATGGKPERPFRVLGAVKSKVQFETLDPEQDENKLCKNYFNAAVQKLVEYADKKGADAVIDVRSTVFYLDGTSRTFDRAECSGDGMEGQSLAQGVAIQWLPPPHPEPTASNLPSKPLSENR